MIEINHGSTRELHQKRISHFSLVLNENENEVGACRKKIRHV